MATHSFVSIVQMPPADCARCTRPTFWKGTPELFRPENAVTYSGCRDLCGSCYRHLRRYNRDGLANYPRQTRKGTDVYDEYEFLKTTGITGKQDAARLIGMSLEAFERAIHRVTIRKEIAA